MAHILELFALVEIQDLPPHSTTEKSLSFPSAIKRIVRTYESKTRAEQDLELLSETSGTAYFGILAIPHIES